MRIHLSFLVGFLFFATALDINAQTVVRSHDPLFYEFKGNVELMVRDSTTKEDLPGAAVFFINKKDTLKTITNKFGRISRKFNRDTITIITSHIGYKTDTSKFIYHNHLQYNISINLKEDFEQINSIIVQGDAIAMVMKGDTTVFNSAAFKTLEGAPLSSLLSQFPGVSIGNKGITFKGQKIDRILFNGQNLFGKNVKDAISMVYANEVKSVEVYAKTKEETVNTDDHDAKEQVMDVRTWKPLEHVGMLVAEKNTGLYTSNIKKNPNYLGKAFLGVNSYTTASKEKLDWNISAEANHNYNQTNPQPSNSVMLNAQISSKFVNNLGWLQAITAGYDNLSNRNGSETTYSPTYAWNDRNDSTIAHNQHWGYKLGYRANIIKRTKRKAVLQFQAQVNYNQKTINNFSRYSSWRDDSWSGYEKHNSDLERHINYSFHTRINHPFSKPGRRLAINFDLLGNYLNGKGDRIDTLANSINNEWLDKSKNNTSVNPMLEIKWHEKIGKKSSLILNLVNTYSYVRMNNIYTDMYINGIDLNSSANYTQNYISNILTASYTYGTRWSGLYFNIDAGIKNIYKITQEHLAPIDDWSKNYIRPVINAALFYSKGEHTISSNYSETEFVPSSEEIRNVLDDSNPFFMRAGNPKLSLPVVRTIKLSYNTQIAPKNLSFEVSVEGKLHSNAVSSKTTFFTADTFLTDYNYTAPSNSSLIMPVNVNGNYNVGINSKVEKFFTKLKTKFIFSTGYNIDNHAFYLLDTFKNNLTQTLNFNPSWHTNLSTISIDIINKTELGQLTNNKEKVHDFIRTSSWFQIFWRIYDNFELHSSFILYSFNSTNKTLNYTDPYLHIKLSYLFGKNKAYLISLFCNDLTNSQNGSQVKTFETHIQRSYYDYLGRVIGLQFKFNFSRR